MIGNVKDNGMLGADEWRMLDAFIATSHAISHIGQRYQLFSRLGRGALG